MPLHPVIKHQAGFAASAAVCPIKTWVCCALASAVTMAACSATSEDSMGAESQRSAVAAQAQAQAWCAQLLQASCESYALNPDGEIDSSFARVSCESDTARASAQARCEARVQTESRCAALSRQSRAHDSSCRSVMSVSPSSFVDGRDCDTADQSTATLVLPRVLYPLVEGPWGATVRDWWKFHQDTPATDRRRATGSTSLAVRPLRAPNADEAAQFDAALWETVRSMDVPSNAELHPALAIMAMYYLGGDEYDNAESDPSDPGAGAPTDPVLIDAIQQYIDRHAIAPPGAPSSECRDRIAPWVEAIREARMWDGRSPSFSTPVHVLQVLRNPVIVVCAVKHDPPRTPVDLYPVNLPVRSEDLKKPAGWQNKLLYWRRTLTVPVFNIGDMPVTISSDNPSIACDPEAQARGSSRCSTFYEKRRVVINPLGTTRVADSVSLHSTSTIQLSYGDGFHMHAVQWFAFQREIRTVTFLRERFR
jgi:hypothetical protein